MSSSNNTNTDMKEMILFRGIVAKLFDELRGAVSISLAQEWSPKKTDRLREAVQAVVERNPILSGTLESRKGVDGAVETVVHYASAPSNGADHLIEIDAPKEISSPAAMDAKDYQQYIHDHVLKLFPAHVRDEGRKIKEECEEKTRIFEVYIVPLPNNFVCYAMQMTHAIADGTTYYHLMEQIKSHMATGSIHTNINWDVSQKMEEVGPRLMPPMARNLSAMLGSAVYERFVSTKMEEPKYILLSKSKINQKKRELKDDKTKFLSANDIVMAAVGQATLDHVDVQTMLVNARGRHTDILDKLDAGNLLSILDIDARAAAENPGVIRRAVESQQYYKDKNPPVLSMIRGRFMTITNWAGLTQTLDGTVAHWTGAAFIRRSQYHLGAIFEYNADMLGLVSNCPLNIEKGHLLSEIMVH